MTTSIDFKIIDQAGLEALATLDTEANLSISKAPVDFDFSSASVRFEFPDTSDAAFPWPMGCWLLTPDGLRNMADSLDLGLLDSTLFSYLSLCAEVPHDQILILGESLWLEAQAI